MKEDNSRLDMGIFENYESNVRSYCRSFPTVFIKGKGALLLDEANREYIDFFSGAGALNYGHNPEFIKKHLINLIEQDCPSHALDMYTATKREFLTSFVDLILKPRNLDYKVQFCGPTGANSVEAALKLARLATGRQTVCFFTGGWHGMTSGCLSVTGNRENRQTTGAPLPYTSVLPYCSGPSSFAGSLDYIESLLDDPNSGLDTPAAIILETVQAEGGVYVAEVEWLRRLRDICDRHQILMIVDDIQVGCGRAGAFFSFERAGIVPDIVCLAKSISGYGLPMALLLMRPDLDVWKPGQHTGTFRGNQHAFLCGRIALEKMWNTANFEQNIEQKSELIQTILNDRVARINPKVEVRGIGMIWGVDMADAGGSSIAKEIAAKCFKSGLIVERSGRNDSVLKIMPPLITEDEVLEKGLHLLCDCIEALPSTQKLALPRN